jgi:hypothetical protein
MALLPDCLDLFTEAFQPVKIEKDETMLGRIKSPVRGEEGAGGSGKNESNGSDDGKPDQRFLRGFSAEKV